MEIMYYQLAKASYQDSLKVLEADIQHANALAASIPRAKGDAHFQMKLVYNHLAPLFLFFLQWMDCSCTYLLPRYLDLLHILVYKVHSDGRSNRSRHGRKATVREFYGVILPSLERLHGNLGEFVADKAETSTKKVFELDTRFGNVDLESEEECGICLEPCTKMVLPNCCHALCIRCYRDWNTKSESCPFCRGNIKRVNSQDLWVLTCNEDVVDPKTVTKEDILRFYLYINSLPKDYPDALFLVHYEYSI